MTFRYGIRLGIDVGSVRIGVARSDASGVLAVPVETIDRRLGEERTMARLGELIAEFEPVEVLVGYPLAMSGAATAAASAAVAFAEDLAQATVVPVRLIDERLTTVTAQRNLHAAGRTHRGSRSVIDQAAAVIVVQQAIDAERASGRPIGTTVRRRT